ncbi:hypothetical protein I3900191A7_08100 [Clostridium baratii]|uniref:Uncharacterized protein n=1 Tax=Clostridium nitritogenes TaxID=83340 RepID=A0ABN1LQK7_9CLOT|nr:Uncharacterised protein [Clostridium baratii]
MNEKEEGNTFFLIALAQLVWTAACTSIVFLVYKIFVELI